MMARNDIGGTSTKDLLHWIQNTRSGNSAQFDYGAEGNMIQYGQETPLNYDIASLKTRLVGLPIIFFVGENDAYSTQKDIGILLNHLPDTVQVKTVPDYNHLDYAWAADSTKFVNQDVFDFLKKL